MSSPPPKATMSFMVYSPPQFSTYADMRSIQASKISKSGLVQHQSFATRLKLQRVKSVRVTPLKFKLHIAKLNCFSNNLIKVINHMSTFKLSKINRVYAKLGLKRPKTIHLTSENTTSNPHVVGSFGNRQSDIFSSHFDKNDVQIHDYHVQSILIPYSQKKLISESALVPAEVLATEIRFYLNHIRMKTNYRVVYNILRVSSLQLEQGNHIEPETQAQTYEPSVPKVFFYFTYPKEEYSNFYFRKLDHQRNLFMLPYKKIEKTLLLSQRQITRPHLMTEVNETISLRGTIKYAIVFLRKYNTGKGIQREKSYINIRTYSEFSQSSQLYQFNGKERSLRRLSIMKLTDRVITLGSSHRSIKIKQKLKAYNKEINYKSSSDIAVIMIKWNKRATKSKVVFQLLIPCYGVVHEIIKAVYTQSFTHTHASKVRRFYTVVTRIILEYSRDFGMSSVASLTRYKYREKATLFTVEQVSATRMLQIHESHQEDIATVGFLANHQVSTARFTISYTKQSDSSISLPKTAYSVSQYPEFKSYAGHGYLIKIAKVSFAGLTHNHLFKFYSPISFRENRLQIIYNHDRLLKIRNSATNENSKAVALSSWRSTFIILCNIDKIAIYQSHHLAITSKSFNESNHITSQTYTFHHSVYHINHKSMFLQHRLRQLSAYTVTRHCYTITQLKVTENKIYRIQSTIVQLTRDLVFLQYTCSVVKGDVVSDHMLYDMTYDLIKGSVDIHQHKTWAVFVRLQTQAKVTTSRSFMAPKLKRSYAKVLYKSRAAILFHDYRGLPLFFEKPNILATNREIAKFAAIEIKTVGATKAYFILNKNLYRFIFVEVDNIPRHFYTLSSSVAKADIPEETRDYSVATLPHLVFAKRISAKPRLIEQFWVDSTEYPSLSDSVKHKVANSYSFLVSSIAEQEYPCHSQLVQIPQVHHQVMIKIRHVSRHYFKYLYSFTYTSTFDFMYEGFILGFKSSTRISLYKKPRKDSFLVRDVSMTYSGIKTDIGGSSGITSKWIKHGCAIQVQQIPSKVNFLKVTTWQLYEDVTTSSARKLRVISNIHKNIFYSSGAGYVEHPHVYRLHSSIAVIPNHHPNMLRMSFKFTRMLLVEIDSDVHISYFQQMQTVTNFNYAFQLFPNSLLKDALLYAVSNPAIKVSSLHTIHIFLLERSTSSIAILNAFINTFTPSTWASSSRLELAKGIKGLVKALTSDSRFNRVAKDTPHRGGGYSFACVSSFVSYDLLVCAIQHEQKQWKYRGIITNSKEKDFCKHPEKRSPALRYHLNKGLATIGGSLSRSYAVKRKAIRKISLSVYSISLKVSPEQTIVKDERKTQAFATITAHYVKSFAERLTFHYKLHGHSYLNPYAAFGAQVDGSMLTFTGARLHEQSGGNQRQVRLTSHTTFKSIIFESKRTKQISH